MRRQHLRQPLTPLILLAFLSGCSETSLDEQLGVVKARDLSGTYIGVLEGVTVGNLDEIDDRDRHVIVDLDLLHELTVEDTGELKVRIHSSVIPPLRAFVAGIGPVAINAEFIEFEGFNPSDPDPTLEALKVKQIVFVQYEGEWILVLQIARVGVEDTEGVDEVYVYQYVAYPSSVAEAMSEEEAILYVDAILRLASAVQRPSSDV